MLKPGLKLVIKDEDTKQTTQPTVEKTPTQKDDTLNPTPKPQGLVASWIWGLFKKDGKQVIFPKKKRPVATGYYPKI